MQVQRLLSLLVLVIVTGFAMAQTLRWTGTIDASFFNENNWTEIETSSVPSAGTVDPGVAINKHLIIENASAVVGGSSGISSDILMGTGNLTIRNSTLKMAAGKGIDMGNLSNTLTIDGSVVSTDFVNNASTSLYGAAQLYLLGTAPFNQASVLNIASEDAWIYAPKLDPAMAVTTHFPQVKLNGNALVDYSNARIAQYYYGCAISAYSATLAPLRVFSSPNLAGSSANIVVNTIFSGSAIPGNMQNNITSFRLKKGYMVTMAVESDGTGVSKVYIASESDLEVDALPAAMAGRISFIRVVPWNWVNKKGFGKQNSDTDFANKINPKGLWFYDWGLGRNSTTGYEYAAMSWGKTSLDTPTKRNTVINKRRITHVMSFNEADDCEGQSGQYGSLCKVDTAALWHKHSMKTGLRIVSPSCRENEELNWLKNVNTRMVPAGTRMDVIGMHWYDWGGYSSGAASDANSIFNRFKNRVTAAYNYYKMPIWITEFNANKNRSRAVQDAFLQLALPWLESTPYVERYAYFQPDGGNGSFLDANGNLTSTGLIYMNHVSTPAIKETDYNKYGNNLESKLSIPTSVDDLHEKTNPLELKVDSGNRTLLVDAPENIGALRLINLQGMQVKQFSANTTVDISYLPQGVYLLAAHGIKAQKVWLN